MAGTLEGKIALVTGGSRGIGRAIARRYAREGALVAVHYGENKQAADAVVSEIEKAGGKAFALQGDIGQLASIERMYEALDRELTHRTGAAKFDILVNNAGVAAFATLDETDEAAFDRLFDINVKGLFFVTQKAVPRLRDGGRIVNISSRVTHGAAPNLPAYAATKGAVNTLTVQFAAILGPRGITANALGPGATETDMTAGWIKDPARRQIVVDGTALKRVGEAEDIADAAAFLASNDSRWITGQYIEASGGWGLS